MLTERVDPYRATTVSLAPVSDNQQVDENLEPPFVRIRGGNESYIFADSEIREGAPGVPQALVPDLFNVNSFSLGGGSHQFYARKLKRLAFAGIQIANCVPNLNVRNNVITFFSTATGLTYTVTAAEGIYVTAASLVAALVTALNSVTGASGLTWTATVNPVNPCQWTLATAGGSYHFITSSPMILYGRYLFNLPIDQTNTASKTFGAVYGLYTRYIDVISSALTEYTKNPSNSNSRGPDGLLTRIFVESAITGPTTGGGGVSYSGLSFFALTSYVDVNYDRSRAIEVMDFTLRDEFGQPYYIPSYSTGTPANSALDVIIKAEL